MKKHYFFSLLILAALFGNLACKRTIETVTLPPQTAVVTDNKKIDLGRKLNGQPFSVQNMRQALANLKTKGLYQNRNTSEPLQPTHNYYKIIPHSIDDVIRLDTAGYEIWETPLDVEIANEGDYYEDPLLPAGEITYLYTALPVGVSLPAGIDAQLLQELYLFSDADGDFYDGEDQDPWDPSTARCYTYLDGQPYQEIVCDENFTGCLDCPFRSARSGKINRIKEATAYIKSLGIKPKDLFAEAMKISGNKDELKADSSIARTSANEGTAGRRYRPSGHLSVEDNSAFTNINLKGVTVKARRWFNLHNTITDGNGNFTMGGTYGKKATVLVKFKNGSATTRGINGLLKEWQYVFPVKRNIGLYNTTDMENINVGFAYNASPIQMRLCNGLPQLL